MGQACSCGAGRPRQASTKRSPSPTEPRPPLPPSPSPPSLPAPPLLPDENLLPSSYRDVDPVRERIPLEPVRKTLPAQRPYTAPGTPVSERPGPPKLVATGPSGQALSPVEEGLRSPAPTPVAVEKPAKHGLDIDEVVELPRAVTPSHDLRADVVVVVPVTRAKSPAPHRLSADVVEDGNSNNNTAGGGGGPARPASASSTAVHSHPLSADVFTPLPTKPPASPGLHPLSSHSLPPTPRALSPAPHRLQDDPFAAAAAAAITSARASAGTPHLLSADARAFPPKRLSPAHDLSRDKKVAAAERPASPAPGARPHMLSDDTLIAIRQHQRDRAPSPAGAHYLTHDPVVELSTRADGGGARTPVVHDLSQDRWVDVASRAAKQGQGAGGEAAGQQRLHYLGEDPVVSAVVVPPRPASSASSAPTREVRTTTTRH